MENDKPVERKFFKLKNDIMFKAVFANPNKLYLLETLIKEVIKEDIKIISIKPNELPKTNFKARNKVLDVIAISNGINYNIEVNSEKNTYLRRRNASFIFKMYSDSTPVRESYSDMPKFIQINLTDSNTQKMPLIAKYELKSLETNEKFIDNLEIYEIDISKVDKRCYNENGLSVIGLLNMGKEELQKVHGDEIMEEIKDKAMELNNDDDMVRLMSDEDDEISIMETLKYTAREEGLKEGYEEGIKKGTKDGFEQGIEKGRKDEKVNIAKELLNQKINIEIISKVTGLTKEEIDKLK